jgi:hypothetical protein
MIQLISAYLAESGTASQGKAALAYYWDNRDEIER